MVRGVFNDQKIHINVLFIVAALGVYSVSWINKPNNTKPVGYLQTLSYRAMRQRCLRDGYYDKCNTIMLHDMYGNLNGGSSDPNGYVFNYSNTYKPMQDTIVYRVIIMNNGGIDSIELMDKNTIIDLTR